MTANKCDRCGTLYERECTPDIRINIYNHPYGDEWVDLCPKCQEKLEQFVANCWRERMSWINVKDKLPNENGLYLVIYKAFEHTFIDVKQFAKDLYSIDKYDFPNKHRPGWYEYDNEYGYIERNNITHWMPLPNPPEEGR